jgi:hypothetical protein
MKMTAAGRDFMRVEHQRNVVAAVVSTIEAELLAAFITPANLSRGPSVPISFRKTEVREGEVLKYQTVKPLNSANVLRTTCFTLFCVMIPLSYLSPKTKVRESKIHGRGLFAIADIAKDEIIAVKGDHIVDGKTLCEKIASRLGPVEIQIHDDLFIAPVTEEERELSMLYLNHSCKPNLGMRGEITFPARRDIRAGEETHTRLGHDRRR